MDKTEAVFKEYVHYFQSAQTVKTEPIQAALKTCMKVMIQCICEIKGGRSPPSHEVVSQVYKLLQEPHDPKWQQNKKQMLRQVMPRLIQHVKR